MKKIFKYTLQAETEQVVRMPSNAQILSAQIQNNKICIWALLFDTEAEPKDRRIFIFGTGHEINPCIAIEFIDTVQINGLVFHIFETNANYEKG